VALALSVAVLGAVSRSVAEDDCLARMKASGRDVADQGTACREAENKVCVFQLQLCLNRGDVACASGPMKRKVKAHGSCAAIGKLRAKPDGTNAVCGSVVAIKVKTKKKGRKEGKCRVVVAARSTDKPARRDVDKVTLVCKPNPGECPATIGVGTTTTTTIPCISACDCCVRPVTDLLGCIAP